MAPSLRERLASVDAVERRRIVDAMDAALAAQLARQPWWFVGRPEQQTPEGDWSIWLILAGRGWGKTRTGAEWLADSVLEQPTAPDGSPTSWAIIAETFGDTRNVCVEGPSGLINVLQRRGLVVGEHFVYNRAAWQVVFASGQRIHMMGADNPDAGRGFNFAGLWADEMAKWRYAYRTWMEGLAPALRIGRRPRAVVTTTPKPNRLLAEWIHRTDDSVFVTRGSTFDNAANLSPAALHELRERYEGTRLGRQELYGELLTPEGSALRPEWFTILDDLPSGVHAVRMWDLAASEPSDSNPDPDYTAGFLVAPTGDGWTVLHGERFRRRPSDVEDAIRATAERDGPDVPIWIEQEPGASGKSLVAYYQRLLGTRFRVKGYKPTGKKATRINVLLAGPAEQGRVALVRGPWLQAFLDECAEFPDGEHDDQIDAVASALDILGNAPKPPDALYVPASATAPSAWRM